MNYECKGACRIRTKETIGVQALAPSGKQIPGEKIYRRTLFE